jgi:hypothetical protein
LRAEGYRRWRAGGLRRLWTQNRRDGILPADSSTAQRILILRRLLLAAGLCVGLVAPSFADPAITTARKTSATSGL